MTSEGLPRSWRISRATDLQAVLSTGRRRRTPTLLIAWRSNDTGHPRLGIVVPLHGRTAVARNRLRRRLRELARRRVLPVLPSLDLVVRARAPAYDARETDLAGELDGWLTSLSA